MQKFYTYLNEKESVIVQLLCILGLCLSGLLFYTTSIKIIPLLFALIGVSLFFMISPMIQDAAEIQKFKKNYPEKKLDPPFYSLDEFTVKINALQTAMFVFSFIVWGVFSITAATVYLIVSVYVWDIRHDFYIGTWLNKHFFLKKLIQHLIYFPLTLFPLTLISQSSIYDFFALSFASIVFSTCFNYDICRQLDPFAHPKTRSYIHYFGFHKIFYISTALLLIAALGAHTLNLQFILWPVEFAVFLTLCAVFINSEKYHFAEQTMKVSLLIHVSSIVLFRIAHFIPLIRNTLINAS